MGLTGIPRVRCVPHSPFLGQTLSHQMQGGQPWSSVRPGVEVVVTSSWSTTEIVGDLVPPASEPANFTVHRLYRPALFSGFTGRSVGQTPADRRRYRSSEAQQPSRNTVPSASGDGGENQCPVFIRVCAVGTGGRRPGQALAPPAGVRSSEWWCAGRGRGTRWEPPFDGVAGRSVNGG